MIILGLNSFHADAAAAIVRDGQLIAAAEEERFNRIKHWAGFPSLAIEYCLQEAGVHLSDVDHVAVNQNSRAHLWRKALYFLTAAPDPGLVFDRLRNRINRQGTPELLRRAYPRDDFKGIVHQIEHHRAHLSSAFHVSPFERALVLSVDGFGDFASAAWGAGENEKVTIDGQVFFPHSLGIFYQALTQYLGFPHYGDEYKVMGLAPYGAPKYLREMRKLVRLETNGTFSLDLRYFRHHKERVAFQWSGGMPEFADLFSPELEDLLGPRRAPSDPLESCHHDIAHSIQAMYEEAFFHLLRTQHARTGLTDLAIAGGCGANSVANGKVRRTTAFRRVYVQAAAGDAGGAVGAAFTVWHRLNGRRNFVMNHAYWGPEFGLQSVRDLIEGNRQAIEAAGCKTHTIADETALCRETAKAIADGKVVGWFQGRMEWGPRALGNRSIVCDPRRSDMKAILNEKIKRRESFRPFAPSVLEENVAEWFEEDDAVPFMMQVFQIRADKRAEIPAVTHVDGSGRLQTVSKRTNPRYHKLIQEFQVLTGVPMVLNTSFNENEPVVCTPQQALDCFLRTRMDLLVVGDTLFLRNAK